MKVDYLIVGSGLTGATIARVLKDAGREVLVLEKRSHVGGNVHDQAHPSGIRVHTYGPHYFRTNSEKIWEYVNRFSNFYKFEAVVKSYVDGNYQNWPVSGSYIRQVAGEKWEKGFQGEPRNFEEASLAMMPRVIYEKFVKCYSEKQWGLPASSLSASLARRFDIREDDDPRLMRHPHQGIPVDGYAGFMSAMLSGISVMLNTDWFDVRHAIKARKHLIFTGPIDAYFQNDIGRLVYRGQVRKTTYIPDVGYVLPCGQVNNPDPRHGPHIRTLEWKHMMPAHLAASILGTVLTTEVTVTPANENGYEYPFPDENNADLYNQYRKRANIIPDLLICGRLGEYRYYDMDQAIERAMYIADSILDNQHSMIFRAA